MKKKLFNIIYKSHGFYDDMCDVNSPNSLICFEEDLEEALTFIWDKYYSYLKHVDIFSRDCYEDGLTKLLQDKNYHDEPCFGADTLWVEVKEVEIFKSTK